MTKTDSDLLADVFGEPRGRRERPQSPQAPQFGQYLRQDAPSRPAGGREPQYHNRGKNTRVGTTRAWRADG